MTSLGVIERAMKEWRIVTTLVAVLVGYGVLSFLTMPRQEFPDFTIRQGLVVGVMPGASSGDVEQRLTKVVESYLFSFNEVDKKKTHSVSQEGQSIVFVELSDKVKGPEAPAFWAKLRHGLNELKAQSLPSQVVALIGNNDFGDTSAVLFTLVSEGHSPRDLEKHIEVVETELRRIGATSKLRRTGMQSEVIRITIARERLARYGLRPISIWTALQGMSEAPAPARLDGDTLEVPIHVSKGLRTEQELGELIVLSDPTGPHVRLKDVATITREYGHDDSFVRFNGKTAIVLSIEMQRGNDITHFGRDVDAALERAKRSLPKTVQISRVADQPHVVAESVNHFLRDFGLAIGAVVIVTMLLLPLRVAAVAAVTIPVCVFITLGLLNVVGVELQTVSLAGLIVVLGMVVDNAIVVIDDHVEKLDARLDPWDAAWKSARELLIPVFTATLAIVMAYAPLAIFLTGIANDFVGSLPVTIAIALGTSMALAMLLVPVMNTRFIRKGLHEHRKDGRRSLLERVQGSYDRALEAAFRRPIATLVAGVTSVLLALLLATKTPQQLFPKMDRNQFAVEVYLEPGRSLQQTDAVMKKLEASLTADKRVLDVTSFVGTSSPRFHTLYAPNLPARNYGQLLVNTTSEKVTLEVLREYEARFRGAFPDAWVRWKQLDMQATAAPIEVRISADDIPTLKQFADRVEAKARELPGVTWVRNDFEAPLQSIEVTPDTDAASRLGISRAALQLSLAVGTSRGVPLTTLWEDDYPVRVLLADDRRDASTIDGLRQQYVSSTLAMATVPVENLATFRPTWSEGVIARRNGVRTLTVRVDVGFDVLASDVQRRLGTEIDGMGAAPGVTVDYGGELEGTVENYGPMAKSLAVTIAAIYLILLFQFRRHKKALLVMLTMPLSLFGSVLGLVLMDYPFGFTAFLGVISLMGIVVRNGIILVGYADELHRDNGLSVRDAAVAAGKRRMRPIFLTSVAAAIGVVPMILSRSTLWGPLGSVTAFGLVLSMVLTLFVVPVAYWLMMRGEESRTGGSLVPPGAAAAATGTVALLCFLLFPAALRAEGTHPQEDPLTLERCRALALQHNAQVERSALEVSAAEEVRKRAFTKYFPQISAAGFAMAASSPFVSLSTPGGNLPVYDGNPANLGASGQFAYLPGSSLGFGRTVLAASLIAVQPIYAGGRISNGNRLAETGVEIAKDRELLSRREVIAQTDEKYWRLVSLGEKEKTLGAYESLLAELDRSASDAVRAGLATRNDLLKVELQRKQVEIDRMRLVSGRRLASRDLRRHVGLPESDELALAGAVSEPIDPSTLGTARQDGAESRVELSLMRKAARATSLQSELALGEALPSLSIGGVLTHYRLGDLGGTNNAIVFATLDIPITAWWERSYVRKEQGIRERIAESQLVETRSLVGLEIEKTWDELRTAWSTYEVSKTAVDSADVNLAEQKSGYASGLKPLSDVLEAEVLKHQAEDRRIDARSDYWQKRAAYLRAVHGKEAGAEQR